MSSARHLSLFFLAIIALHAAPSTQTQPFRLPTDLNISMWAESPMFFNPTNIDVDVRGRVWVAEAVNYRGFNTTKLDPLAHPTGDRILILEDTNADGAADSVKVFVQDLDLRAPLGLAVIGDRVVVSASPHVIVYTDANGDDVPDKKEILLTGFGGFDHDHGLHALIAGPDGRWYFNAGNAGPHIVTDGAGWTLRAGSLYTGGTPYNLKNQGGLKSDDGRIWVGGVGLRMQPDGTQLTVVAHNFRNAYELAVDSYGDLWQNDNDDQVMTCRMTWLMAGGNAGYFSADGSRFWQADRRPGQSSFAAHWHQDDPGVLPAGDNTGAGAPAGVVRYESDALGAGYRGLVLSADAGRNVVFGFFPKADGAGFRLERSDFISSLSVSNDNYVWDKVDQDQRKWFRPSDVAVGTDGALYVADWYDPIVGGHQMHDRKGHGRIYRITPKDRTLTAPRIDLETTAGQIQALLSPAINVRNGGFERLRAQGAAARDAVRRVLSDSNPFHRARAVWVLARLGPAGAHDVREVISDSDPQLRITAFRALRQVTSSVLDDARRLASDTSAAVRREVALALRDVPFDQKRDILVQLARQYDGVDRWYLEALGIAASGSEEELYAALLPSLDNRDPIAWDARFAHIAWRLHPPAAISAFKTRAASAALTADARRQAMVALGFITDRRAAEAMADLTQSALADVRAGAAWWMAYRSSNDWRGYAVDGWAVVVPEAKPAAVEAMLPHRALVLDSTASIDRRIEAALTLARSETGAPWLIQLVAENKLPYQLREAAGSVIFANPDRTVRAVAAGYFQRPGGTARPSGSDVTRHIGDAARGQTRFLVTCASCHRRAGAGADIGPDLTDVEKKFDRNGLVEAIVNPNAAIAFGYGVELFVTRGNQTHIGFLQADGASVTIRTATGQTVTLERDNLAARVPLKPSVMPDPIALGLGDQDIADIVAYLMR